MVPAVARLEVPAPDRGLVRGGAGLRGADAVDGATGVPGLQRIRPGRQSPTTFRTDAPPISFVGLAESVGTRSSGEEVGARHGGRADCAPSGARGASGCGPHRVSRPVRRPSAPTRATAAAGSTVGDPALGSTVRPIRATPGTLWVGSQRWPCRVLPGLRSDRGPSPSGRAALRRARGGDDAGGPSTEVTSPWTPGFCSC